MIEEREQLHLERLREGDQESFRWIFNQNHPGIYGFCLKLTGQQAVSEEITSDVFVRLWHKRKIVDPSLPISHFLFKITKDLVWNYLKKESKESQQQLQYALEWNASNPPTAESELILKDYLAIAETAINLLPEKRREVFLLHYQGNLDNEEIARQLDISESTVRVHLSKAIQFLRNYLKSHPDMLFLVFAVAAMIWREGE